MGVLSLKTINQRGCCFCTDKRKKKIDNAVKSFCPYDACPYHELDGFKSYEDYYQNSIQDIPENLLALLDRYTLDNPLPFYKTTKG